MPEAWTMFMQVSPQDVHQPGLMTEEADTGSPASEAQETVFVKIES